MYRLNKRRLSFEILKIKIRRERAHFRARTWLHNLCLSSIKGKDRYMKCQRSYSFNIRLILQYPVQFCSSLTFQFCMLVFNLMMALSRCPACPVSLYTFTIQHSGTVGQVSAVPRQADLIGNGD